MLRWKQKADNPMQMTLELDRSIEWRTRPGDTRDWQPVEMVDVNDKPLTEHPVETRRKQKKRAKVLKDMVKKSKEKAALTAKAEAVESE